MYIAFAEITNFRKLLSVRVDFAEKQTLFVGANNSGKTSAMHALRRFLVEKGKRFEIQDFTVSNWAGINFIGDAWEKAGDEGAIKLSMNEWEPFLPSLDIWLHVEEGELHHVSDLLTTFSWSGGNLGVRLRLEPRDLPALCREYRSAMKDVAELHSAADDIAKADGSQKKLALFPVSLTDFLGRKLDSHFAMRAYLLDPTKVAAPVMGQAKTQAIPTGALPLDGDPLQGLIRINEIHAQRGLGEMGSGDTDGAARLDRDSQRLSDQLRSYYSRHLDPSDAPDVADLVALQAVEAAQEAFDQRLHASFSSAISEVQDMGYPGVTDPKLKIASKLTTVDGLDHEAAVLFEVQTSTTGVMAAAMRLPESSNGLGYQNLISMIFRLMSFRDSWMRVGKAGKTSKDVKLEPIHLVLIEEPEAHLHAQVQQVFINKAYDVLRAHEDLKGGKNLHTQLVVSTHSSHVVHEMSFACLRYFRRLPAGMVVSVPVSSVINLSEVFGNGTETERFVTRYLRSQHCDLFFADAAVLVEGSAEKILVPNFIERHHPFLARCYISLLEINGSHAYRLKPLIDALGLLTLVVSDIDAGKMIDGRVSKTRPTRTAGQVSSNSTLKRWAPKLDDIDSLLVASDSDKTIVGDELFAVRVVYQIPVSVPRKDGSGSDEALPSTFEDSLAMENVAFFSTLKGNGLVKKFADAASDYKDADDFGKALFDAIEDGKKAEFALDVLVSEKFASVNCPRYISDGLDWLETRLKAKQVDKINVALVPEGAA